MEKFPTATPSAPEQEPSAAPEAETGTEQPQMSRRRFLGSLLGAGALATGFKPKEAEAAGDCGPDRECYRRLDAAIARQNAGVRERGDYWKPSRESCAEMYDKLGRNKEECRTELTVDKRDYFARLLQRGGMSAEEQRNYNAYIQKCAECKRQKEFFQKHVQPGCRQFGFK